jgi:hypothetical protein
MRVEDDHEGLRGRMQHIGFHVHPGAGARIEPGPDTSLITPASRM